MAASPIDTKAHLQAALAQLPLYFVENQGQVDERVAYYVQGSDKTLYFTPQGVTFVLTGPDVSKPAHEAPMRPVAFREPLAACRRDFFWNRDTPIYSS